MLRVAGTIQLKAGGADRIRAAGIAMVAATLAEEGCIDYSFASDLADPDLIRIAEGWADEAALGAHSKSAHMATFNQVMGAEGIVAADLKLYSATEVKQLLKI
jgi:quinol monooxygenase YgiN